MYSKVPDSSINTFLFIQVIAGGNYDVDCFVTDPLNNMLYQERKKQYDSFSHTTTMKGVYKVCFSNEFSTFSHKTVYLDFRSGEDDRLLPDMNRATALTQVKHKHHALTYSMHFAYMHLIWTSE